MTESGGSNEELVDHWLAHHGDEQDSDAVARPTLPRRARAVPYDAPPVFERAVLEPLEPEMSAESAGGVDMAVRPPAVSHISHRGEPAPSPMPPVQPVAARTVPAAGEDASTRELPIAPVTIPQASAPQPVAAQMPAPQKQRHAEDDEPVPNTVIFKPRRATRTALTSVLVVWIIASAASVVAAWRDPSQPTIGIAAAIVALTAVTWIVRGGTSVARLTVRGGILEIRKAGQRTSFSLGDSYQIIDVVGKPGSMGWKVLFRRKDLEPYVVDASLVDPKDFMRVLTYYRPELKR